MEGLTKHLGRGREVEVIDFDKSGNVARRWVHMPNNRVRHPPVVNQSQAEPQAS